MTAQAQATPKPGAQATKDEIERRKQYLNRWTALKQERQAWIDHWREIAEHTRPRAFRYLESDRQTAGRKKNQKLINGKPRWALRTLAAGMMAGITSPSRPWFRFGTNDPTLNENQNVKEYLAKLEDEVREALAKSNIYNGLHRVYEDLGGIGTSTLYIEEDAEDGLRAYNFPVGQYALSSSDREAVDTAFREFEMTVRQLKKKFGIEKCSLNVQELERNGQLEKYVRVLHVIAPNDDFEEGKLGPKGMRFTSCWLEVAADENQGLLRESGYRSFPVMAPRWETTGEDVYGTSPAMDALGDCKALQLLEKRKAQIVDKIVDPPMKGPSSLSNQRVSLLPGDVTYVDGPNAATFAPAIEINPQAAAVVAAEIQVTEGRVEKAFYADLWLLLSQSDGRMTATEVVERREEKLLQLGPVMERLQDELLDPLLQRVLEILFATKRLPPPPRELQGRDVRIEYISIMAQAQKLLGTTAVERFTTFVGNLATAVPAALDKLNIDTTIDEYGRMLGVPPTTIRGDDEVAQLRADRAQQQAQAQQLAAAQAAAGTAKDLAAADTGGDNALTTMLRGLGAQ